MPKDSSLSITSVLIANRGEIACRIMRTARAMGLGTIAVYSEADKFSPHVHQADQAFLIGPSPASLSYLKGETILDMAKRAKADCIHPGYGFLSENAKFATRCAEEGIIFVGPPPSAIKAMGLKDAAKALMLKAGISVVPGYHGEQQDADFLAAEASRIGFPVLIKAVAGGGGKGMRRVNCAADFGDALSSAQREALSAFGNANVLVEKYVSSPRHIEMQVFADSHGNVVHLFERDCSLQRRHQKVIEEAPAPGMGEQMREMMGTAAVNVAKAVGYQGAGTVEFIVDAEQGLRPDGFYFMEMNTRLQVEHPVTEAITGLDLVEWQFRIARGERLPLLQKDIPFHGHAVEARVYAEDTENGFLPSTGTLHALSLPSGTGIRVDTGVSQGGAVTPFYDPMIAKVIAVAETRLQALERLDKALSETIIAGPSTNIAFLRALCQTKDFRTGHFDTGFIEQNLAQLGAVRQDLDLGAVAAGVALLLKMQRSGPAQPLNANPWDSTSGFSLSISRSTGFGIAVNGAAHHASLLQGNRINDAITIDHSGLITIPTLCENSETGFYSSEGDAHSLLTQSGKNEVLVIKNNRQTKVGLFDALCTATESGIAGSGSIIAPMHGKVVAVFVSLGDRVIKGQKLAIVEAMKMEHVLNASHAGIVQSLSAISGQQVSLGTVLVILAEDTQSKNL